MTIRMRVAVLAVLAAIALGGCMNFRMNDRRIENQFSDPSEVHTRHVRIAGRPIRYVESGSDTGVLFFFIHGAPGSLDDFIEYAASPRLQRAGRLISYDRPGYGYSDFGRPLASMEEHARIAMRLVEELRGDDRVIVVAHSFGGTVALRMAVDYPGRVERYIVLAASASAEDEVIFWFNRPVSSPVINWAVPRAWRVANAEKLAQRENLRLIAEKLDGIADPLLVVHGTTDRLVPVAHAEFLRRRAPAHLTTVEILEDTGHMFIWEEVEFVTSLLLESAHVAEGESP
jgi:pimeloyl-ACP methyl ester carboxylesterase